MKTDLFDENKPQALQQIPEIFVEKRQGQECNISGKLLEESIESAFRARGIHVSQYTSNDDLFERRILFRNVHYTSIYGARSFSEFSYRHAGIMLVRIECRSQQVAGSVDEKFPYLLKNAIDAMPEPCVWFVLDGTGARSRAVEWLKREAGRAPSGKIIRVYTLAEGKRAIKKLVERGEA
jgi:hypothetical protein